jgi:hypothetical protein
MNVPSYFYWEIEKLKQNMWKSHDIKIHLKIYNDIRYCDTITSISNNSDIIINLYMDMDMKSKIIDNKIYDKRNMSVEDILENIDTILNSIDNTILLKEKNIKEYLCKTYNLHLTIGESELLMETIKRYLDNKNYISSINTIQSQSSLKTPKKTTQKKIKLKIKKDIIKNNIYNNNTDNNTITEKLSDTTTSINKNNKIDITMLESIILNDHRDERCELFIHNDKLYSINRKHVGYIRDWIDDKDEVPSEYKNNDGTVMHPNNNLPIIEIEITPKGSCITGLGDGLYREYEYDELLEIFRKTSYIQKD